MKKVIRSQNLTRAQWEAKLDEQSLADRAKAVRDAQRAAGRVSARMGTWSSK